MLALLKRIRDAIWPQSMANECFISKGMSREIESIMPGETMNITVKDREFVILEREEFEVMLARGGYRYKKRAHSIGDQHGD